MTRRMIMVGISCLLIVALVVGIVGCKKSPTPTPTPRATATPTATVMAPTATPTPAPTPTPTYTLRPTATPTPTVMAPTATPTPTPKPTATPTPRPTATPTRTPTRTPTPTPTPSPVTASVSPATKTAKSGETFTLDVVVNPQSYGITAGDVEVTFDPVVFEVTDIQPGNLMGSNVIMGTRQMDNIAGKAHIAVGRVGAIPTSAIPTLTGTLATVQLKVRDGVSPRDATVAIASIGLADQSFNAITGITKSASKVSIVP